MLRKPNSGSKKSNNEPPGRPPCGKLLPWLFLLLFATGCVGYQLGPTNGIPAGSRSVRVNLFQNRTFEPRLAEPVGNAIRKAIQRDGTFRLATRDSGDVVVDGIITEFRRSPVSFQPSDIVTVRDYELILVADVLAVDRRSGEVLLKTEVNGRTVIRAGPDLSSAERQAAPLLADDLARNLTSLLAEGSW